MFSVPPDSYGAFAYAYDRALGERFFEAVRPLVDEAIARHCGPRRTHLDLACGTGLALAHLGASGWWSVGIDASLTMLRMAHGRAPAARLLAGDLRRLPLRGPFALVTCLYDSLNHMMERSDLLAAFRAVRGAMDRESRFLFDVNHPEIYPAVWGLPEPFFASGAEWELEIGTTWHARERLGKAAVRGWAMIAGRRVTISEQHRQRAWSEEQIGSALAEAGLEPIEIREFDPFKEGGPTVKVFYVCAPKR